MHILKPDHLILELSYNAYEQGKQSRSGSADNRFKTKKKRNLVVSLNKKRLQYGNSKYCPYMKQDSRKFKVCLIRQRIGNSVDSQYV